MYHLYQMYIKGGKGAKIKVILRAPDRQGALPPLKEKLKSLISFD